MEITQPMKKTCLLIYPVLMMAAPSLLADTVTTVTSTPSVSWHAQTLWMEVGNVLLFAGIGVATAIIGYKLFDKCTPGDLHREIIEHRNVAAAIVAGSVILGVSIIIAAAMIG